MIRSSLPSPFTSPKVAEYGVDPVAKVSWGVNVAVAALPPVPKSTLAVLLAPVPKFAVMMSSLPSLLISSKLTEDGLVPTAKSVLVAKVPLPLPNSMLALLELEFAVMMSSLPSPLISPKFTDLGLVPTAKSVLAVKVPSPLPKSTLAVLAPVAKFAVTISSLPSPFTSPNLTDLGLVPVAKSVLI